MKRLIIAACLALNACATLGITSPAQGLYGAYGGYEAAQGAFATYAEGPTADPKIVHAVRLAKDAPATQAAIAFGKAFSACHGSPATVAPGVNCAAFNFTPTGVQQTTLALRSLIVTLQRR